MIVEVTALHDIFKETNEDLSLFGVIIWVKSKKLRCWYDCHR